MLYQFKGSPDGANPRGGLTYANGAFYGTTEYGGAYGFGTVFQLLPPGAQGGPVETVLYSFQGADDGNNPATPPVVATDGTLYGVAYNGTSRYGVIYSLSPPAEPGGTWTESVLYNFAGGDDQNPDSALVISPEGKLYGVADGDGEDYYGEVFELAPPAAPGGTWTHTVLYSLNTNPLAAGCYANGVTGGPGGVLFVTDYACGGVGAVFELTPPRPPAANWTLSVPHLFSGGADGGGPEAATTMGPDGIVYGTAALDGGAGWGNVFQLMPPATPGGAWTENVLYNFTDTGDGGKPAAPLVLHDGALYGTAGLGGQGGVVFKLQQAEPGGAWTDTVLYAFPKTERIQNSPLGNMVVDEAGAVYGVTYEGPGRSGLGMVFKIAP